MLGRSSVVDWRLAMGLKVPGPNPTEGKRFSVLNARPDRSWGPITDIVESWRIKWSGSEVDHPLHQGRY
jgi:hypothetical protein